MNKVFYYHGKEVTLDILSHRLIKLNKVDSSLKKLIIKLSVKMKLI